MASAFSLSSSSAAAPRWPRHIGILNDYVRIPYANGSSFASQRLYREFRRRGHDVTVVGPHDPQAQPADLPLRNVMLKSLPLQNHPGVYLPMPSRQGLRGMRERRFDVLLGQTGSALTELGVWLRLSEGVPFLCVNTIHLPSVYNVVLPDAWVKKRFVQWLCERQLVPRLERHAAQLYNRSDGLIVLCQGLKTYWQQRGVTAPIFVIPRSIDVTMFAEPEQADPFDPRTIRGGRLLVLCRHTREKAIKRLLHIFAERVAPVCPQATLTLVGDGPDHDDFRRLAAELGVAERTFFPGECSAQMAPAWYRHADLFVYTSLSETYGQVISEAAWCGLPAVAMADGMGVSHQIQSEVTGVLVDPAATDADAQFAHAVTNLLENPLRRRSLADQARRSAHDRCSPANAVERHYEAFEAAARHCRDTRATPLALQRYASVLRWTSVHTLAYLAGLLRSPATLNRHGRRAPDWDERGASALPLQAIPNAL